MAKRSAQRFPSSSFLSFLQGMKAAQKQSTIDAKDGRKSHELQLLRNVYGVFEPGVMTALIGATGAGKTTLLDCLSGRKTGTLYIVFWLAKNVHKGSSLHTFDYTGLEIVVCVWQNCWYLHFLQLLTELGKHLSMVDICTMGHIIFSVYNLMFCECITFWMFTSVQDSLQLLVSVITWV